MEDAIKLFPDSTVIKDYAYSQGNPLRYGHFEVYPEDEEDEEEEEDEDEYDTNEILVLDYEYNDKFIYGIKGRTFAGQDTEESEEEEEVDVEDENIEINRQAIALFDFVPENDNEVALTEGQVILISYRHGQGWLVAEDPNTGENGLVPEEYVEILSNDDIPKPVKLDVLDNVGEEWVDTDESDHEPNNLDHEKAQQVPDQEQEQERSDETDKLQQEISDMSVT